MRKKINSFIKSIYNGILLVNNKYKEIYKTKLKFIFQFLPANLYLLILFVILCIIVTPRILNNYTSIYSSVADAKEAIEIVDKKITQIIDTSGTKKIEALGITYSTYKRINNSFYKLIVFKNDKVIYKKKINASVLEDNKEVVYKISSKVNKDDEFKFEVRPIDVKKGNGITILKDTTNNYLYRVYKKSSFYNYVIILSLIFLIIFFVINYLINNNKIKSEEKLYKTVLIYLLISVFIYPPLFVPDTSYHLKNSYTISQSNIISFLKSNNFKVDKQISNIKCLNYGKINKNPINVKNKEDVIKCFNSKKLKKSTYKTRINTKVAYIFSGLGIKITMLFTNSPMLIYIMGTLFNAITSFLIILYSLKVAPKHKRLFLVIALIPVFIQQMCSYSYDTLLNSLCLLVIAYLLKFFDKESKINIKDLIIYAISIVVISIIKIPYILIGVPIIFVSKDKIKCKKMNKFVYLLLLFILLIIAYIIPKLGGNIGLIDASGSGKRGMSLNSLFDIKYTLLLIYHTIKFQGKMYLESFVGSLGWLNGADMPKLFIYSYLVFIILSVLSEKQYFNIKRKYKICIILLNIMLIGGIFLSMYLGWTTKQANFIEGVQGRYFYVPVLCIMLALIPKKNKIDISNQTVYTFLNMSCLLYLISILYLFY